MIFPDKIETEYWELFLKELTLAGHNYAKSRIAWLIWEGEPSYVNRAAVYRLVGGAYLREIDPKEFVFWR